MESSTLSPHWSHKLRGHFKKPVPSPPEIINLPVINCVYEEFDCWIRLLCNLAACPCCRTVWRVQVNGAKFFFLRLWITLPGNSNRITKSQDNFWSFNQTRNYLSCVLRLPVYLCLHWSYHGNLTSWWSKSRGCELEMQPRFGKMELKLEVIPLFCAAVALASLVSRPVEAQQGDDANVFNPRGKPQIPSLSFI